MILTDIRWKDSVKYYDVCQQKPENTSDIFIICDYMVNLGQEMNDERVTDLLINQHSSSLTDKYASNISTIEIPI